MTDRRWIDEAANVADIRDADGLPQWVETRGGGFSCGDRKSVVVGILFSLEGFDLPDFDGWLSALRPCGAKTQLLEWRALAIRAALDSKHDEMRPYLVAMGFQRKFLDREGFLLPLARHGKRFPGGRRAGTGSALRKAIAAVLKRNPTASAAAVWDILAARGHRAMTFRNPPGREKYVETEAPGTAPRATYYRRFANIVSEERRKLK